MDKISFKPMKYAFHQSIFMKSHLLNGIMWSSSNEILIKLLKNVEIMGQK